LNPQEIRAENRGDYLLKEIEFNSTLTRRIRVTVTFPLLTKGPWPAVVCMHGHGGKPLSVYEMDSPYKAFAAALAARNYVTIAPVVSQHEVYEEGRTLMGERLWDTMRCIDYLESLLAVDSTRIGCAGLSLGGEMAMWLGAMDLRIKATVSAGFLTRMDQMEQGHCMCWKFPGLRELVDYADIYSLIAPRPLMCQNGLKEPPPDFTVELARAALKEIQVIYTNYSMPENVTLVAHPEGHVVDVQSLLYFFKKQLNRI
jgi:dienelactone hydrolase